MGSLDVSAYRLCTSARSYPRTPARPSLTGVGRHQLSYYRWLARSVSPRRSHDPSRQPSTSEQHQEQRQEQQAGGNNDQRHSSAEVDLEHTIAAYNDTRSSLNSPSLRKVNICFLYHV